ncbi:MAG: PEP/pyruvate-binding domain-containing protein [Desulfovibrionaceae bacterium]
MLSRLLSFFTGKAPASAASGEDGISPQRIFARRHHRFKLFLTAWNKFQEVMTEMEYTLCCEHPFGMYRVRALCTKVSTQVFQCIQQFNLLSPHTSTALQDRFAALQAEVSAMVYPRGDCLLGPEVMSLDGPGEASAEQWHTYLKNLTDPTTQKLVASRAQFPQCVPPAFVLTAAGCQHIMQHDDLQNEINRRVQALGGLSPDTLFDLSENLGRLVESIPLPTALSAAIICEVNRLRAITAPNGKAMRLILRGRLWPEEQDGDHGLLLWGPSLALNAPDTDILNAIRTTLAHKYHAQGLVYRRYRGIPDTGASVCVVCMAVEEGCIGGLAHTGNPMQPTRGSVHIYSCHGLPEDMEHSRLRVDITHVGRRSPHAIRLRNLANPDDPSLSDTQAVQIAELALHLEEDYGQPQALTWLCPPDGGVYIVMCRNLVVGQLLPAETLSQGEGDIPPPLACGGITASPGIACGPVHVVRNLDDARTFPQGGVLVVERDLYQWAALMDRASAVITEQGVIASRLGSLAREFGKPAVFGLPNAMSKLDVLERVTVYGDGGMIYPGCVDSLIALAPPARDFMPDSPVYRTLQRVAEYILPLTLDPDSPDFKAAHCHTYHDIARYCHEKAVSSMFAFGSQHKHAPERVKQLLDQGVLKQFWVVNLDDGFSAAGPESTKGRFDPTIKIENITSVPMQSLWRGMNAYPWQGPPPVDSKGFMSVLFEATANPHLDPAAQSAYFSEKNYFMVTKDYCSLHSRFGFHFVSVEARLGERAQENSLVFHLRGGAANIQRRILRVRFVADILWECGFAPVVRNDAVMARIEGIDREEGLPILQVAGYLTIHTRQLDMIMTDPVQVKQQRSLMLSHCRSLLMGHTPLPTTGVS